jgi:hypothetical protein
VISSLGLVVSKTFGKLDELVSEINGINILLTKIEIRKKIENKCLQMLASDN